LTSEDSRATVFINPTIPMPEATTNGNNKDFHLILLNLLDRFSINRAAAIHKIGRSGIR
jgi:hypothetical protein